MAKFENSLDKRLNLLEKELSSLKSRVSEMELKLNSGSEKCDQEVPIKIAYEVIVDGKGKPEFKHFNTLAEYIKRNCKGNPFLQKRDYYAIDYLLAIHQVYKNGHLSINEAKIHQNKLKEYFLVAKNGWDKIRKSEF